MFRKIFQLVRTETARDVSIMTFATAASAVIAAVFFILVARILGPEILGLFSLATAASYMFADIFDISFNTSLVRFVSRELNRNANKADKYLKFIFKLKIWIGAALFIIVSLFSPVLSTLLLGKTMPVVIIFVGLGTGFYLIFTFAVAHLQARKQFLSAAKGIILLSTLRILCFFGLILIKSLRLMTILGVYFFVTPIAILYTMFLAPRDFLRKKNEKEVSGKFLKYNIPLTVGFTFAAVGGRVDNFILANLASSSAVGFYSAAFRLFSPAQFLAGSLSIVFAPRFASFQNIDQAKTYFKKILIAIAIISLGILILAPFSSLIIQLFYGRDFLPSASVLSILFFGFAALMLQAPFTSIILYYFSNTKLFAVVSFIQLILISSLNLILIPEYSQNGSAMAFVITQLFVLFIFTTYTVYRINKKDR